MGSAAHPRSSYRIALLAIAMASFAAGQDSTVDLPPDFPPPVSQDGAQPQGTFHSTFRFHAYADTDYLNSDQAGQPNRFEVGEVVLFGTAAIAPRLSALSEVVIDTDSSTSTETVPINVERLLLQYRFNDYLRLEAGQYRTAIGYYSTAYLRGAWFQTAISRPRMFAFEEDGGILPLHTVGVSASGLVPSGALGLGYFVETGNTRTWGSVGTTSPAGHDAINVSLVARPKAAPRLEAGFSDYHDKLALIPGLPVDRSVVTAHLVYVANRFEFLNEGAIARVSSDSSGAHAVISGFYSQIGYRFGPNWGPYARIEKLSGYPGGFASVLAYVAPWRSIYTCGVRYDWSEHVAFKLEGTHEADWGAPHYYQAAMQIAFAF